VGSLMMPGVLAAAPDEPIMEVADRMRTSRVGAATVMEDERLVGILTERDLLRALADGLSPRDTPASACMTADPQTIAPDAEAEEAAERMIDLGVRHLPVVEDGRVVGIISARNLLHLKRPRQLLSYEPW
jgi:CBS domain-containing protein